MKYLLLLIGLFFLNFLQAEAAPRQPALLFAGPEGNDLYGVLEKEGLALQRFDSPEPAIRAARKGDAVFVVADGYPQVRTRVCKDLLREAGKKKLRLYVEYPEALPGLSILADMTGRKDFAFTSWPEYVRRMYGKTETLPAGAIKQSIARGVEWFYNARLLIHPSWQHLYLKYQAGGTTPFGPPLSQRLPKGDGKLGILEGHASKIYHDGSQKK